MHLDPKIWMPYFQFILTTIALYYPTHPNDTTKKKYYDFIQNLPLFFPVKPMGNDFIELLDSFPVTPYLDSKMSFMKWTNFISNKLNKKLNLESITLYESLEKYYQNYKSKEIIEKEITLEKQKYIFFGIFVLLLGGSLYLYSQ